MKQTSRNKGSNFHFQVPVRKDRKHNWSQHADSDTPLYRYCGRIVCLAGKNGGFVYESLDETAKHIGPYDDVSKRYTSAHRSTAWRSYQRMLENGFVSEWMWGINQQGNRVWGYWVLPHAVCCQEEDGYHVLTPMAEDDGTPFCEEVMSAWHSDATVMQQPCNDPATAVPQPCNKQGAVCATTPATNRVTNEITQVPDDSATSEKPVAGLVAGLIAGLGPLSKANGVSAASPVSPQSPASPNRPTARTSPTSDLTVARAFARVAATAERQGAFQPGGDAAAILVRFITDGEFVVERLADCPENDAVFVQVLRQVIEENGSLPLRDRRDCGKLISAVMNEFENREMRWPTGLLPIKTRFLRDGGALQSIERAECVAV